jgi:hypothetical protein
MIETEKLKAALVSIRALDPGIGNALGTFQADLHDAIATLSCAVAVPLPEPMIARAARRLLEQIDILSAVMATQPAKHDLARRLEVLMLLLERAVEGEAARQITAVEAEGNAPEAA